ncbi:hypothetical protein C3G32_004197 [Salmonella enterica subsp. enterica serovar Mbandaka]|nr:hypothetical protein [Salmonella enterica subsp. enterica serovar Mbandaka]
MLFVFGDQLSHFSLSEENKILLSVGDSQNPQGKAGENPPLTSRTSLLLPANHQEEQACHFWSPRKPLQRLPRSQRSGPKLG